jgi:hypothetical protein
MLDNAMDNHCPALSFRPNFIRREAIAQEAAGQYLWPMTTGPILLTVEQEKARAVRAGLGLQRVSERVPGESR